MSVIPRPAHARLCRDGGSILHLPRAFGKQAAQHSDPGNLEAGTGTAAPSFSRIPIYPGAATKLQTKLAVNRPGDQYEQEADRVAQQVMRIAEPSLHRGGGKCPGCSKDQGEQERVQAKRVPAHDGGKTAVPPVVQQVLSSTGQPLDSRTRGSMESRFGHDFRRVRIHTGARAEEASHAIQARAFTLGHSIVFGAGQYAPGVTDGRRLLAHELTHVIQQNRTSTDIVSRACLPAASCPTSIPGSAADFGTRETAREAGPRARIKGMTCT